MRKLKVFNNISLDGYFTDSHQDMSWAHNQDSEWTEFASENARGEGVLVFGRITYDLMRSFWPTPEARASAPAIAERMNSGAKVVFSRTLKEASWQNTQLIRGDLASEVQKLKAAAGPDLVLMGSGSIVAQLAEARLIDEYQLVVHPLAIGNGRTLFEGVTRKVELALERTRTFKNGNVVIWYSART
jgi:dihydrofolate reductase